MFAAKPWKAPGDDGLKQKDRVLLLFQTSLDRGDLPNQWRNAKIIPLKKPNKGDYTKARAQRPISLLSTLGKVLESVVAERISHAVETSGLLPTNHFAARKKCSTEQALLLLQEHIQCGFGLGGNSIYPSRSEGRLAATTQVAFRCFNLGGPINFYYFIYSHTFFYYSSIKRSLIILVYFLLYIEGLGLYIL